MSSVAHRGILTAYKDSGHIEEFQVTDIQGISAAAANYKEVLISVGGQQMKWPESPHVTFTGDKLAIKLGMLNLPVAPSRVFDVRIFGTRLNDQEDVFSGPNEPTRIRMVMTQK